MQREPNDLQMDEIALGIQKGLNVDLYSNLDFTHEQMREIRLGLEYPLQKEVQKDLDVSIYADPCFSPQQMSEIRQGLEHQLEAKCYADTRFNAEQMKWLRLGLEAGLDISCYLDSRYTAQQMEAIYMGFVNGAGREFQKYLSPTLNAGQLTEIALGLKNHLSEKVDLVSLYAKPEFDVLQMKQIRLGLEWYQKTAFSPTTSPGVYIDNRFSAQQMYEIRKGLEYGLDVSLYSSPNLPSDSMCKRRQMLLMMRAMCYEEKLKSFSLEQRQALNECRSVDILPYIQKEHTPEQILSLYWAALEGVDLETINDPKLSAEEMFKRIPDSPKTNGLYRFRPVEELRLSHALLQRQVQQETHRTKGSEQER